MNDLQKQLRTLNSIGIPYSAIASRAHLDRTTISKFAHDKASISLAVEIKLHQAIEKIKEEISHV